MKKGLKIFLIILAAFILVAGTVTVWQWDNITAVVYFMKYSKDDLETLEKDNKQKLDDTAATLDIIPRELTEEEQKALADGIISEEDAVEISLGTSTLKDKLENSTDKTSVKKDRLSELVARLYVLKSTFISKLDGLAGQAAAEYKNTPNSQKNASWTSSKISKYMGLATELEAECDVQVEEIISELKDELKKQGKDNSLINTIRSTYDNEKQIKKAYYLNKYLK